MVTGLDRGTECSASGIRMLGMVAKTKREWNKFGFVVAYLAVFFLVMRFVFHFE